MSKSVTQNINAPVYGHVVGGDLTVVQHHQHAQILQRERESTWRDFSSEELQKRLREERARRWRAWRRYWFNPASALMSLLIVSMAVWVFHNVLNGQMFRIGATPQWPMPLWAIGACMGIMLAASYWLQTIRRVEGNLARVAQMNIDTIQIVLLRRETH